MLHTGCLPIIFSLIFFSYCVDANLNSEQYCLVVPQACILTYMKHFHNKLLRANPCINVQILLEITLGNYIRIEWIFNHCPPFFIF